VKFLIDAMLPSQIAEELNASGHDAISPWSLGSPRLADSVLIDIAIADVRVIVTENRSDFAAVTRCAVLFVRKSWWPPAVLAPRLATALVRWANANPTPGLWARWLDAEFR
jgi:hypothetical protein